MCEVDTIQYNSQHLMITVRIIVRDLCCSSFVKDAAEDLMDQYGAAAGGGGEGVGGSHCEMVSL